MIRRILVAVDGFEPASRAVALAADLAVTPARRCTWST
jgi:nucleotide-binding universal stress UspA family protein